MTTRISFWAASNSVAGEGAQSGVAVRPAPARPCGEHRDRGGLEVADDGDERKPGEDDARTDHERRGAAPRAAPPERAGDQQRGGERADHASDSSGDGLSPAVQRVPEGGTGGRGE